MNLPKHQFWGAGEPDCPPELKAPNGELHTMRCKVCGDGWRKSGSVCLPNDPARVALAELVACKALKDAAEAIHFAGPLSEHGEGWKAEYDRMRGDYLRRQPLAWEAARDALGVDVPLKGQQ